jgi:hypothetical protein
MNRPIQVTSGIAVLAVSILNAGAVIKMIPYQGDMPTAHFMSLGVTALAVVFSFVGAYILIAGAKKSK